MSIGPPVKTEEPCEFVVTLWCHLAFWGARRRTLLVFARSADWAVEVARTIAIRDGGDSLVALEVERVDTAREFLERIEEDEARMNEGNVRHDGALAGVLRKLISWITKWTTTNLNFWR